MQINCAAAGSAATKAITANASAASSAAAVHRPALLTLRGRLRSWCQDARGPWQDTVGEISTRQIYYGTTYVTRMLHEAIDSGSSPGKPSSGIEALEHGFNDVRHRARGGLRR